MRGTAPYRATILLSVFGCQDQRENGSILAAADKRLVQEGYKGEVTIGRELDIFGPGPEE